MKAQIKIVGWAAALGSLLSPPGMADAQPRHALDDPVAYCRAHLNLDEPGADYTGTATPEWMQRRLGRRAGMSAMVAWRCMGGRVLACVDGGGSARCDKGDANRVATHEMRDYCRAHPGQQMPVAVTGSETIYSWRCVGGTARAGRALFRLDARGYPVGGWRVVTRGR